MRYVLLILGGIWWRSRSEQLFRQEKSGSHDAKPYNVAGQDITKSMQRFSSLEELYALAGERGEGGEAAQKAGKDKQPEFITDMNPIKPVPKKSDQQAAARVGDKCTQGKSRVGQTGGEKRKTIPAY